MSNIHEKIGQSKIYMNFLSKGKLFILLALIYFSMWFIVDGQVKINYVYAGIVYISLVNTALIAFMITKLYYNDHRNRLRYYNLIEMGGLDPEED